MSNLTPNLNLFKYDLETDGKSPFNITQSLNNNWDIIDESYELLNTKIENLSTLTADVLLNGNNGYIKFSNEVLYNWGLIDLEYTPGTTEIPWTQPTLGQNNIIGRNSFAVSASSVYSGNQPWKAFDKNASSFWGSTNASPAHIIFYNPTKLRLIGLTITNYRGDLAIPGYYYSRSGRVFGSNDGINWTLLKTYTNNVSQYNSKWTININSNNFYNYYKLDSTDFPVYGNQGWFIQQIDITANQLVQTETSESKKEIVFPCSYSNNLYSYSLACLNNGLANAYIYPKTTSSMTLNRSNSTGTYFQYITIGY